MTPIPIEHSYTQGYIPAVIGMNVCVLDGDYHPDQIWMPFMAGSVIKLPVDSPRKAAWPPRSYRNTVYAREPASIHRNMYVYQRGVPQMVLPFVEYRSVPKGEFGRLMTAALPDWDRDTTNPWHRFERSERSIGLICIPFDPANKEAVRTWCQENCTGRFTIKTRYVILQRLADAPMCKMLWWHGSKQ